MGTGARVRLGGRMLPATTPHQPTSPTAQPGPSPWRGVVTVLLGVLGPLAVWVIVITTAAMLSSPDVPEGRCEGIGWGCELSPRDGIALLGFVGGAVLVPAVTLVLGIVTLLRPVDRRRQTVVGGVAGFAMAVVVLAAFAIASTL